MSFTPHHKTLLIVSKLAQHSLNWLLPPLCLRCDEGVETSGSLCAGCWRGIDFITGPYCPCCSQPYELDRGDLLCPQCLAEPPPYRHARAAVRYDAASRDLVLRFKHGDQTHMAQALARLMVAAAGDLLVGEPLIITPVPLHRRRLWQRAYNQSALLAQAIAKQSQIPVCLNLLTRCRATPPQAKLTAAERAKNVRKAFIATPRHAALVQGKIVVLIDDVITTGATIHECTRALQAAGAAEVRVLTFAKTV